MARIEIRPQPGLQEIAMQAEESLQIYGGSAGSGKSHLSLMKALRYIEDPRFNAVYFRRNTKQAREGLFKDSSSLYNQFNPRVNNQEMKYTFSSGSTVKFDHMQHEKDKEQYQGLQLSMAVFDEATHFTRTQVSYIMGRLRSEADMNSFMLLTCNPDPDSWILDYVKWYLDENGLADPEKNGKVRYYLLIQDHPVFSDNKEELEKKYPEACYIENPNTGEKVFVGAKSMRVMLGTIFDNPILIKNNPTYLADLMSLEEVEKQRKLYGNWYARPQGANYIQREWFLKADKVPLGAKCCRAWDKASSEPSELYPSPDYTASCKMYKTRDGFYYIVGDYIDEAFDDKNENIKGRFRKRAGSRDNIMINQAKADGSDVHVILPKDPGAAGDVEFRESSKKFISNGFVCKKDPMPTQKSKLTKFEPFASAVENGLVYIVESTFNTATLEHFYKELEAFNGERSSASRKDDIPDACASAFNYLSRIKTVTSVNMSSAVSTSSRSSKFAMEGKVKINLSRSRFR